jgi:malic enzyme
MLRQAKKSSVTSKKSVSKAKTSKTLRTNTKRRLSTSHQHRRTTRYGDKLNNPHILNKPMHGQDFIYDPLVNKGIAYTQRERDRYGLRGLLPARIMDIEEQVERAYMGFKRTGIHARNQMLTPSVSQESVDKHVYLSSLQDRNETLFYRLITENLREMVPIVYTPTVGYACQHHGELWRRARGIWVNGFEDTHDVHGLMNNWPSDEVDVVVVTDGSRILGLGDLGAYGMGIPTGKLITYVAGSGIHPARTLPMFVDIGTNNQRLIDDPLYLGVKKPRLEGEEYFAVWDEVIDAITYRWPNAMIQFEDIRTPYAEALLKRYRNHTTCFNDDIQGTGAMVVGGILAALRLKNRNYSEIGKERVLCVGAGSAGSGVCSSIRRAMVAEGVPVQDSYRRFWLTDQNGVLTNTRQPNPVHENFLRDITADNDWLQSSAGQFDREQGCDFDLSPDMPLSEIVKRVKPTVLLGLSGVGGVFNKEVIKNMTEGLEPLRQRPIIFALSNPTDSSECTAEQAYDFSGGKAIFASGSPFPPIVREGQTLMQTAQGNNIFIYPGLGLGVTAVRATGVSDEMLYEASKQLSLEVPADDLQQGILFPKIENLRDISLRVACAVAKKAREQGLATEALPPYKNSWDDYIADLVWQPDYQPYINPRM